MRWSLLLSGTVIALLLSACGGGQGTSQQAVAATSGANPSSRSQAGDPPPQTPGKRRPLPASQADLPAASCQHQTHLEGGRHYRVEMPSRVDGAAIVFEVFEPAHIDCHNKNPLILQGHGFGGSRETTAGTGFMGPVAQLVADDYTVISIDQRGHGESGGTVRVMDPDYAGKDLVQILDWAEQNLDYLAYRNDNLLLGTVGGSYGGGYQYLLYMFDPDHRLDAMVPQITWNDLDYSLAPGGAVKGYWGIVLSAMGDAETNFSMDPLVRSTLVEAATTNHMPESAKDFFDYHSMDYACRNSRHLQVLDAGNTAGYTFDPALQLLPLTADGHYVVKQAPNNLYPVDALMFQGTRDTLFTFNEAYRNYQCLQRAGGDVRLLTYQWGHQYLEPDPDLAQDSVDHLQTVASNLQNFYNEQSSPASRCGNIGVVQATLAWFDEKLRGEGNASDVITSGHKVCMSLSYGDSVNVDHVTVGGTRFPVQEPGGLPVVASSGMPGAVPMVVPLTTLKQDALVAGIPTVDVDMSLLSNTQEALCQQQTDPVTGVGTCDVILYVGVGVISPNRAGPELIDGQVHPLRGLGHHQVNLEGVAERLKAGDQLVLMIYGVHPTYVGTFSRDILNFPVKVTGSTSIPLLTSDGQSPLPSSAM